MLCCWLQQLQEFGGPEVDKPDLLKGSIGSLKNLGLNNATNATTKTASGANSIVKHNPCLDKRARYNVSTEHVSLSYKYDQEILYRTRSAHYPICCSIFFCILSFFFGVSFPLVVVCISSFCVLG